MAFCKGGFLSLGSKKNQGSDLTPAQVRAQQSSEVRIIDVRQPDEFVGELGHIEGAELKTLGTELDAYLSQQPKDTELVFVCKSGGRSGHATDLARKLGFSKVHNMVGGMLAWNKEGFEVKR